MKKFLFALLLIPGMLSAQLEKDIETASLNIFENATLFVNASQDIQSHIKILCKQAGLSDGDLENIKCKELSSSFDVIYTDPQAKEAFKNTIGLYYWPLAGYYLIIDQDFFHDLTAQELAFVLGREILRFKNNTFKKQFLVGAPIATAIFASWIPLWKATSPNGSLSLHNGPSYAGKAVRWATFLALTKIESKIAGLIHCSHARSIEASLDAQAIEIFNCADGARSYLQALTEKEHSKKKYPWTYLFEQKIAPQDRLKALDK